MLSFNGLRGAIDTLSQHHLLDYWSSQKWISTTRRIRCIADGQNTVDRTLIQKVSIRSDNPRERVITGIAGYGYEETVLAQR